MQVYLIPTLNLRVLRKRAGYANLIQLAEMKTCRYPANSIR